jgi:hypothetical protein
VLIGGRPAWRAVSLAAAAVLRKPPVQKPGKKDKDKPKPLPVKQLAGLADMHMCAVTRPSPHGPGVVVTGSKSVEIDKLPASRQGDTILEAAGPPNRIVDGEPTVIIGD